MRFINVLFASLIFLNNPVKAQDNSATAAVAGALIGIGAAVASIEAIDESFEYYASQYILSNHPEINGFELKVFDITAKKSDDESKTILRVFKLEEIKPTKDKIQTVKRRILLAFTSNGFQNENGVNYSIPQFFLLTTAEWAGIFKTYVSLASGNESIYENDLLRGVIARGGFVEEGSTKPKIPFYKLTGDMYLVSDYNDKFKIIYNERTLGIFLKQTQDLVQLKREVLNDIHKYLFRF